MSEPLILKLQNRIKELENKSAILAYNSLTQDVGQSSEVTVNLNTVKEIKGEDFELTNNTIKCKKAGYIALNYKIYLDSKFGASNNIICKIFKNNDEESRIQYRPSSTLGHSFSSETRIIEVEEDDIIKLTFINYSGDTKIGNASTVMGNSINAFYL